ncbi:MAG: ATP-binding cassette domain-containing protein [Acidimicrobiia bacterium]|nr:ATP-binding cassette domain-containing protein [Acidimicrobiia bacterium]
MGVDITDLEFSWPSSEAVFSALSLRVKSHSVHAVMGRSGCGKSTLLSLIAGLESPSHGTIAFVGERIHRQHVAMVFQDPRLLPWWPVDRNVAISAEFEGRGPEWYRRVKDYYTNLVGLKEFANRMPHQLSLGMQTKASIGRGFAHDADVMLLDEPFVHLDAISRRKMWVELETHWELDPRTYVLVTHDPEEAVMLADRVSILTPAPSHLYETIEIDLPRPRTIDMLTHPGFRSALSRVWEALERAR